AALSLSSPESEGLSWPGLPFPGDRPAPTRSHPSPGCTCASWHDWRMATTFIWLVPLVVGLLGGLGSAVVTQLLVTRREKGREQALWAREDTARSYEHLRTAYVDFTKEFHHRRKEFIKGDEAPGDYLGALHDRLIQIHIFGTNESKELADEAYNTLVNWVFGDEEIIPEADDILASLRSEIRHDLSIPSLRDHQKNE
ncbi:MAG: hypothetical protein ACRDS1_04095, partial [Pseudonocardiaceae bacterium]